MLNPRGGGDRWDGVRGGQGAREGAEGSAFLGIGSGLPGARGLLFFSSRAPCFWSGQLVVRAAGGRPLP